MTVTAIKTEPTNKPASNTPFHAWLQTRESRVWSSADTCRVLQHIGDVERLALRIVERAERRGA